MADFTPVGDKIIPVKGMSLSEIVGAANGINTYKQGKISLSLEEQKQKERKNVQQFLSNPENFQTEGRIDIDKLNSELPKIAPITAPDWIGKFTTLGRAQTDAIEAKQNLTQEQKGLIGQTFGILGRIGIPDKKTALTAFDLLKKQNPGNKDFDKLIDAYKTTWNELPEDTNFSQLAIAGANTLLKPDQQQAAFAPTAGTLNTGAAQYQTFTQPSIAGEPPRMGISNAPLANNQLPPNAREVDTGRTDLNNNPIINVFDANGQLIGTRAGTGTPLPSQLPSGGVGTNPVTPVNRLPPGQTEKTLDAANESLKKSRDQALNIPNQIFNYNKIIDLSDKAFTGNGAKLLADVGATYGLQWTSDNASNLKELGHYMSLQAKELANDIGSTDASRALASDVSGSTDWTPQAIKNTARVNRALATQKLLFQQGAQAAYDKTQDIFSVTKFQNKWPSTVDINAIRLYDAQKNKDKEGFQQIVDQLGGKNSDGYKNVMENAKKIQKMLKGE